MHACESLVLICDRSIGWRGSEEGRGGAVTFISCTVLLHAYEVMNVNERPTTLIDSLI